MRILIADDSSDIKTLLRLQLERMGSEVILCDNGAEAIRLAQSDAFDCILLDLQMPEIDGIEAAKSLRRLGFQVKIVALTASTLPLNRFKCLAAGFDDYLIKPLQVSDLQRITKTHLAEDLDDPELRNATISFLRNTLGSVSELRHDLHDHHFDKIAKMGHRLRGTSASYGFTNIASIFHNLEIAAQGDHFEEGELQLMIEAIEATTKRAYENLTNETYQDRHDVFSIIDRSPL